MRRVIAAARSVDDFGMPAVVNLHCKTCTATISCACRKHLAQMHGLQTQECPAHNWQWHMLYHCSSPINAERFLSFPISLFPDQSCQETPAHLRG
jgi:hypothetical protein